MRPPHLRWGWWWWGGQPTINDARRDGVKFGLNTGGEGYMLVGNTRPPDKQASKQTNKQTYQRLQLRHAFDPDRLLPPPIPALVRRGRLLLARAAAAGGSSGVQGGGGGQGLVEGGGAMYKGKGEGAVVASW